MKINIGYLLFKRALLEPEKEALVVVDVRRTYKELNLRSNRLANAMKRLGISHGDRVVDKNNRDVPVGEIGEVLIRTAHLMKGYWNNPSATSDTIKNGWLYSGDIAKLDEDNFFIHP